jgi:hypothetical protein
VRGWNWSRKGTFKALWKHVYKAHREILPKNQF